MSTYNQSSIALDKPTLALWGIRAIAFQVLLIAAAVVLPVVSHLFGAPVRFLLPMHWPVILAGLVYGWRAGILTGALAPIVSYFLSGLPLPNILPSMTVELLTYGLVTGLLRELVRFNPFFSVAIALVLGRIVFILSVRFGTSVTTSHLDYFRAALTPGIIAAFLQIALLPFLAKWWIRQERRTRKNNCEDTNEHRH
ncbi:MAG: ECF transporter S component [Candidatus Edwardsbacteria bacterium]